jgi:hypothetical protein
MSESLESAQSHLTQVLQNHEETEANLTRQQQIFQTLKSDKEKEIKNINSLLAERLVKITELSGQVKEDEVKLKRVQNELKDRMTRDEAREKELRERHKSEAELRKLNEELEKQVEKLNTRIHMLERQLAHRREEEKIREAARAGEADGVDEAPSQEEVDQEEESETTERPQRRSIKAERSQIRSSIRKEAPDSKKAEQEVPVISSPTDPPQAATKKGKYTPVPRPKPKSSKKTTVATSARSNGTSEKQPPPSPSSVRTQTAAEVESAKQTSSQEEEAEEEPFNFDSDGDEQAGSMEEERVVDDLPLPSPKAVGGKAAEKEENEEIVRFTPKRIKTIKFGATPAPVKPSLLLRQESDLEREDREEREKEDALITSVSSSYGLQNLTQSKRLQAFSGLKEGEVIKLDNPSELILRTTALLIEKEKGEGGGSGGGGEGSRQREESWIRKYLDYFQESVKKSRRYSVTRRSIQHLSPLELSPTHSGTVTPHHMESRDGLVEKQESSSSGVATITEESNAVKRTESESSELDWSEESDAIEKEMGEEVAKVWGLLMSGISDSLASRLPDEEIGKLLKCLSPVTIEFAASLAKATMVSPSSSPAPHPSLLLRACGEAS